MSNEYEEYYDDLYCEFEDRVEALDFLPDGWVKSFVPKLKEELFGIIGSYAENFEIVRAKEKWGTSFFKRANRFMAEHNKIFEETCDIIDEFGRKLNENLTNRGNKIQNYFAETDKSE